jgi:acyl-phosphate glycerol 3-phosphate acyltransferase
VNETISAISLGLSALAVLAAYLVGSIPFGYLIVRWLKGIDIRTVGSGNLGATNVGRTIGFRYFLLVLALDLLKGCLPTLGFPWILSQLDGTPLADLPVLIALAAILGHTFPVYLKFRGGKGIATSLGSVLALDPVSCAVAVLVFGGVLLVTRYVSLSALVACLAFAAAHFARDSAPISREHLAMTLFTIGVVALLIFRHRSNLARIWAGTENRVSFGGRRAQPNSQAQSRGCIKLLLLFVLVLLLVGALGGLWLHHHANQTIEVSAGPWVLRETDRVYSGQQRVDRIAFAGGGTRLGATCPRYDRVVIYQVESPDQLQEIKVIDLDGRPVAISANGDRFLVLVRPSGDRRHLEPGWWETFDLQGNRVGRRTPTGFYPDDFAVAPDRTHLVVIDSGRAEGDAKKPKPSLEVIATNFQTNSHRVVGRLTFDQGEDPERISISASGQCAAVLLANSNQVAAIDLSTPESPKVVARTKPIETDTPYVSYASETDWIMMPVSAPSEAVAIDLLQCPRRAQAEGNEKPVPHADYVVCTRQKDSVLELFQSSPRFALGRLPLRGPLNLGRTRPTGLAYCSDLGLLAVATRSGTIHLIELIPHFESPDSQPSRIAASHSERLQQR